LPLGIGVRRKMEKLKDKKNLFLLGSVILLVLALASKQSPNQEVVKPPTPPPTPPPVSVSPPSTPPVEEEKKEEKKEEVNKEEKKEETKCECKCPEEKPKKVVKREKKEVKKKEEKKEETPKTEDNTASYLRSYGAIICKGTDCYLQIGGTRYQKGDTINGWKIESITIDTIHLRKGEEEKKIIW